MWNSFKYRMGCFFSSLNLYNLFSPRLPAAQKPEEPKVYSWYALDILSKYISSIY